MFDRYWALNKFIKDYKHKLCLEKGGAFNNKSGINFHFYQELREYKDKQAEEIGEESETDMIEEIIRLK